MATFRSRMRKSYIFSNSELAILEIRKTGSKKDPCGIFSRKVKPKIKEILEFCKVKKALEKLI